MNEAADIGYDFKGTGETLLIDKPLNWTSFDVVKKIRTVFNVRKVGHAGTLDPKATGLLIVCTGKKTKTIEKFSELEKEYIGTCELGVRTPSFDTETSINEWRDISSVTGEMTTETAKIFQGKQMQIPPMYSAVKYGGKPLYKYARAGRTMVRTEREINVFNFDIIKYYSPYVDFRIICSKGTYIRSLIDEYGLRLGCGATLLTLRRTRIGAYNVIDAMSVDKLIEWRNSIKHVNCDESGSLN